LANSVACGCGALSIVVLAGCGPADQPGEPAGGSGHVAPAPVSDAGCFWQEGAGIGDLGAGMGISTW